MCGIKFYINMGTVCSSSRVIVANSRGRASEAEPRTLTDCSNGNSGYIYVCKVRHPRANYRTCLCKPCQVSNFGKTEEILR